MDLPRLLYSIPGTALSAIVAPKRVRQLRAMRDAGVHGYEFNYRLGEGWPAPGRYDWSGLDTRLAHFVENDPAARILVRLDCRAPAFWLDRRPLDAVDYALGAPNAPITSADLGADIRPLRASLASAPWRRATGKALVDIVQHIRSGPYADHVAGVMTSCCTYGEWHYWGFFHLPDTSPAMTEHFRRWVRRQYGDNLSAVAKAWGRPLETWEHVVPPGRQRLANSAASLRQGRHAAWTLDYVRCHQALVTDTLIEFARAVKRASDGQLLTGAFHGYFFNTPWRDEGGHLEFLHAVDSPHLDYLSAPQIYDVHARDIGGTGLDRALVPTVLAAGKRWISEADTPTHIGRSMKVYWKTREEIARNAEDSVALVRRDAARALTGNHALWWFDFGHKHLGGEYLHPRIMREIGRLVELAERAESLDTTPVAQLAVAYDDQSQYHLPHWRSGRDAVSSGLLDQLIREAQYVGAPAEPLHWRDVEARHRLVIVANALHLSPDRRRQLRDRLCRDGRWVVWMYAPGALGDGAPQAGIRAATGLRVRRVKGAIEPEIRFGDQGPLTAGLRDKSFRYTPAPVWMEREADLSAPTHLQPAFYVDDPAAEPLAWWTGTDQVALARRDEDWGTSIYCALPLLPRRMLRNLLRAAGGHLYSTGQDVWMANRSLLAVHTARGGRRTVRLPEPADVHDAITGKALARDADRFTVTLPRRSTTIWVMGR